MPGINYDISPTDARLTSSELYEGRIVCFSDVSSNPNNVGILERNKQTVTSDVWIANINNIKYRFDKDGNCVVNPSNRSDDSCKLYGLNTENNLDITSSSTITRSSAHTTINSLLPKDSFAICAMEALINSTPNAISMDNATILLLATKAYKIAEAMLYVGTLARGIDATSQSSQDAAPVDAANLSDNTQKILYNINETLKAIKSQDNTKYTTGIKIATVPQLAIDNPSGDEFDVSGGGGGGSLDAQTLKEICENNLNWTTLEQSGEMISVVGFKKESKNGQNVYTPIENPIGTFLTRLEAAEVVNDNHSVWYWLRKAKDENNNDVIVVNINTFLQAYGKDIYANQKINWRDEIKSAIDTAMTKLCSDNSTLNNGVLNVVRSLDVNTDNDWR